jgi:hypothetical protein
VQPIIDIHIHIMPYHMMKPAAMDLMKRGRKDYAEVMRYCEDPKAFLGLLDSLGIERAGLINYVAPKIIGFTPAANDWSAKYCSAAPDRLIAFGGVLPGTVPDTGAEVDRMAKLGIRAIKLHPSHQAMSPNGYMNGNRELAAIYERAQANNMPVMIHTGTSIFPGARNLYAQPMLCDDVSIDYPRREAALDERSVFSGAAPQEYVHGHFRDTPAEIDGVFSANRRHCGQSFVGNGLAGTRRAGDQRKHREISCAAD